MHMPDLGPRQEGVPGVGPRVRSGRGLWHNDRVTIVPSVGDALYRALTPGPFGAFRRSPPGALVTPQQSFMGEEP